MTSFVQIVKAIGYSDDGCEENLTELFNDPNVAVHVDMGQEYKSMVICIHINPLLEDFSHLTVVTAIDGCRGPAFAFDLSKVHRDIATDICIASNCCFYRRHVELHVVPVEIDENGYWS